MNLGSGESFRISDFFNITREVKIYLVGVTGPVIILVYACDVWVLKTDWAEVTNFFLKILRERFGSIEQSGGCSIPGKLWHILNWKNKWMKKEVREIKSRRLVSLGNFERKKY